MPVLGLFQSKLGGGKKPYISNIKFIWLRLLKLEKKDTETRRIKNEKLGKKS